MKTLGKTATAVFFNEECGYIKLRAHWSGLMRDKMARKNLIACHHLLYSILRGKNWQKGFAPITNEKKLANGAFYNSALRKALFALHREEAAEIWAPFADFLSPAAIEEIRRLVLKPAWNENPLEREPYAD